MLTKILLIGYPHSGCKSIVKAAFGDYVRFSEYNNLEVANIDDYGHMIQVLILRVPETLDHDIYIIRHKFIIHRYMPNVIVLVTPLRYLTIGTDVTYFSALTKDKIPGIVYKVTVTIFRQHNTYHRSDTYARDLRQAKIQLSNTRVQLQIHSSDVYAFSRNTRMAHAKNILYVHTINVSTSDMRSCTDTSYYIWYMCLYIRLMMLYYYVRSL